MTLEICNQWLIDLQQDGLIDLNCWLLNIQQQLFHVYIQDENKFNNTYKKYTDTREEKLGRLILVATGSVWKVVTKQSFS